MRMQAHKPTGIHAYKHACIRTHPYMHTYIYIDVCIYLYTYIRTDIRTYYTYIHTYVPIRTYIRTLIHDRTHAYMQTYMHACIKGTYIHACTCIRTYKHTCLHTDKKGDRLKADKHTSSILPYLTIPYITLHYITFTQYIAILLHCLITPPYCTTLLYISTNYSITKRYIAFHCSVLNYIALHYITRARAGMHACKQRVFEGCLLSTRKHWPEV